MDQTELIVNRLRLQAAEVLADYKKEIIDGGEPTYPQAAADTVWLCYEFERLVILPRKTAAINSNFG